MSQAGLSRSRGGSSYLSSPLHAMQEQIRRMDVLFNHLLGHEIFPSQSHLQEIEADVYEGDTEFTIHAALPGIEPEDIQVEANEDAVFVTAVRRSSFPNKQNLVSQNQTGRQNQTENRPSGKDGHMQQPESQRGDQATAQTLPQSSSQNGESYTHHRQSRYSSQSRYQLAYTLPGPIDPDKIEAHFRHGMLELCLPKQQAQVSRSIPIRVQPTNTTAGAAPDVSEQSVTPGGTVTPSGHEGAPASKMGSHYTPSASEDHTSQAQSVEKHANR